MDYKTLYQTTSATGQGLFTNKCLLVAYYLTFFIYIECDISNSFNGSNHHAENIK